MPDQGLTPPYLDPSQYPNYLDAQRKQMLAQMLMGNASQANQTPANWDSMKVVPRRGLLSNLAGVADSALAGRALKGSQQANQKYFQGLYGGDAPSAPSEQDAAAQAPELLRNPNPASDQPAPQNPMIPPGMSRGTAAGLMGMMGPDKYAEHFIAPNYSPAAIKAQIRAAGIDPDSKQGRQMALAALNKATTNMQDVRPGGTLFDVSKGQPVFSAPQNGVQTQWGPQGPTQGLVPGAAPAAATMAGAEAGAKAVNTPQAMPTQGGGTRFGYPQDAVGTPPALRDPNQAAPASKSYFPQGPQTSQVPQNGAWGSMPKLPVSTSLGAPDEFTKGRLQEAGKKDAELSTQYGKEADLADQKLQYNSEALKALPGAEVGPSSSWMTEHRANFLEWGVPESLIPGSGKTTNTMELNKNLKQSALQGARSIFGSRMTQMEVKLQHDELSPSTSMTKDAIASLMQQDNIKQQYAKQRSQDYGKYVQSGGDPLRFESWYSKTFPLTQYAAKAVTPPAAIERVKQNPHLAADFKAKYGWDPTE